MITFFKKMARVEKGLCTKCGKKPCDCRRFRKHIRKFIPEIFRSARIGERYQSDPTVEFRAQTLRVTDEIEAERKRNVPQ